MSALDGRITEEISDLQRVGQWMQCCEKGLGRLSANHKQGKSDISSILYDILEGLSQV